MKKLWKISWIPAQGVARVWVSEKEPSSYGNGGLLSFLNRKTNKGIIISPPFYIEEMEEENE